MLTADFDYHLPDSLIAQTPAEPRDSCRLLVLDRQTGKIEHRIFKDILDYLDPKDLLVVNDTKVMPARLSGKKSGSGGKVELLLLRKLNDGKDQLWEALVKPGKRLKPGAEIELEALKATILNWGSSGERGVREILLSSTTPISVDQALHKVGKLPLPPYITNFQGNTELYQTVYSKQESSAAAPTAGLHFTRQLLQQISDKGIGYSAVCLEVGLDTFRQVKETNIEDHLIHTERYSVPNQTVQAVQEVKAKQGRVVAVGTTSVRSLESAFDVDKKQLSAKHGEKTSLYITPGFQFKVVDALLTNFHTPKSTLMMLVSAFASKEVTMNAYQEAIRNQYRFLSFGDAMLIL